MKKLFAVLLILALLVPTLALATIDVTTLTDEQLSDLAARVAAEQMARTKKTGEYLLSGNYDKYFVGLKDVLVQGSGSDRVLVLVFDFSHSSDEAEMFLLAADIKVFQDGVELEDAYFIDHPSSGNSIKEIKKGATLEVAEGFKLASNSPIEIEMNELWNFSGRKPDALTMNLP